MKTRPKSIFNIFTLFALLASLIGSAVFVTPVYAASYVVNTTADNTTSADSLCTLREAINAANNTGGSNTDCGALSGVADTITFSVSGTIPLGSTLPPIVAGQGTLTIDGAGQTVTISGNNAVAIMYLNSGASLTLNTLTIANALNNNTSTCNSNGDGGGICNDGGTLTITNSTFSNNYALGSGGAIYSRAGTTTISNSTFSGNNVTNSFGGAIAIQGGSTVNVTNSTFSGNNAPVNKGGGILNFGTLNLYNTIIANSTGGDCFGNTPVAHNNNLIRNTGTNACSLVNGANGNQIGVDPLLVALASNGGPTWTFALLAGSPAIDAGNPTVCANSPVNNLDQRGVTRPIEGDLVPGAVCDIGAYEYSSDATGPTMISNNLVASYTSGPSSFTVTFSENVYDPAGDSNTDDVTNPANYLLVEDGANGTFNTLSCIGGLVADDTQVTVTSVTYIPNTSVINFAALPAGTYRLFVCGTTSIVDLALNPLNGGADTVFNFVVATATAGTTTGTAGTTTASSLPKTGFAPHKVTSLPAQPASLAYSELGSLWLEIPSQNIKSAIVGVPKTENGWDTSWLANDTGWLNGTAFPTWEGNSVLTAHVYDANGLPGPFVNLKELKYGDQIIVNLYGQQYIYEVRSSRLARPTTTSFALEHLEDNAFLTLITCQGYNPLTDSYFFRRIVRAVLISVE